MPLATDVIAGALLGSGVSLLVFAIAQQYLRTVTTGRRLHRAVGHPPPSL